MYEKILYTEYPVSLKGRTYRVIVPKTMENLEGWVTIFDDKYWDNDFLDGDRTLLKTLRDVGITLFYEPEVLIYLPLRKIPPLAEPEDEMPLNADVLYYCTETQFRRSYWYDIKKKMKKNIARVHSLKYETEHFRKCFKDILRFFDRHSYELYCGRYEWHVYDKDPYTVFVEGAKKLYVHNISNLDEFMGENLEEQSEGIDYALNTWAYGMEVGFLTRDNFKKWKK